MSLNFCTDTFYSLGNEAVMWAPMAIGYATNNSTVLVASEVANAAMHLYNAYNSESEFEKLNALSNAAISLVSPLTYHPAVVDHIPKSLRSHIFMVMGGNNILRGASEILSTTKEIAVSAFYRLKDGPDDNNKYTAGRVVGIALRLGLGISRVYTGREQINAGFAYFKEPRHCESPTEQSPENVQEDSFSTESKEEFHGSNDEKDVDVELQAENSSPVSQRDEFSETSSTLPAGKCCPVNGKLHPDDVYFYERGNSLAGKSIRLLDNDGRCDFILFLRSKDKAMHYPFLSQETTNTMINAERVRTRTIGTVGGICDQIKSVHRNGGKVKGLIIYGHGGPEGIVLNPKDPLYSRESGDIPSAKETFKHQKAPTKTRTRTNDFDFHGIFLNTDNFYDSYFKNLYTKSPFANEKPFDFNFDKEKTTSSDFLKQKSKPFFHSKGPISANRQDVLKGMRSPKLNLDTQFPKTGCLDLLEPDAPIVLLSCNGGAQNEGRNIADVVARQAIGHPVVVPNKDISNFDLKATLEKWGLKFSFVKNQVNVTYVAHVKKGNSKS